MSLCVAGGLSASRKVASPARSRQTTCLNGLDRVKALSPRPSPLAGFEVTNEGPSSLAVSVQRWVVGSPGRGHSFGFYNSRARIRAESISGILATSASQNDCDFSFSK